MSETPTTLFQIALAIDNKINSIPDYMGDDPRAVYYRENRVRLGIARDQVLKVIDIHDKRHGLPSEGKLVPGMGVHFIAFYGDAYYPLGGARDHNIGCATESAAAAVCNKALEDNEYRWAHYLEVATMKTTIVKRGPEV